MMNRLRKFFGNHADDYVQYYKNEFPRRCKEDRATAMVGSDPLRYACWQTALR